MVKTGCFYAVAEYVLMQGVPWWTPCGVSIFSGLPLADISYIIEGPTVRLYHPVVKQNQDYYS